MNRFSRKFLWSLTTAIYVLCLVEIELALAAQPVVGDVNNVRLFKRDYSVHPILGTRAGSALLKTPSVADCRKLIDISADFNYFEHFKAEAFAAQTFCDLVLTGSLSEYMPPSECDNVVRRHDVSVGCNQIPVRISFLNGKIISADIRWRVFGPRRLKPADQITVEQVHGDRAREAISLCDSLIGKTKNEIIARLDEPLLKLGFNDIWDSRQDITANWFYYSKPLYPIRLAFRGDTCFDACMLSYAKQHDLMMWRICQFNGSKNSNRPDNLAHCVLPVDGPQGKTIAEIVELYGEPQRIETSGNQKKMIYPIAPGAYCELTITDGKCEEHVAMMAQTGGVPYSEIDD